eukprot:UN34887
MIDNVLIPKVFPDVWFTTLERAYVTGEILKIRQLIGQRYLSGEARGGLEDDDILKTIHAVFKKPTKIAIAVTVFILQRMPNFNITDRKGLTPLMIYSGGSSLHPRSPIPNIVRFLVDLGLNTNKKEKKHGLSALFYAVASGSTETIDLLFSDKQT